MQKVIKRTPQRLAISKLLKDNKNHPSARDIYNAVLEEHSAISFATVYNTLEVMKKNKVVQEIHIDAHKKRFDPDMSRHHHFMCLECKQIWDVHSKFDLPIDDPKLAEFEIIENKVNFFGKCLACKKKLNR